MKKLDIISTDIRVDSLSWLYSLLVIPLIRLDSGRGHGVGSSDLKVNRFDTWSLSKIRGIEDFGLSKRLLLKSLTD